MLPAPKHFRGSWLELFRDHIEPNLPPIEAVARFHEWLIAYCHDPAAVFSVRYVRGAERRQVYSTDDGTVIAPSDNSPAWVVHALLMEQRLSCYRDFRDLMLEMPAHMFDVPKLKNQTANANGWYVAHIYPAKNGDTKFRLWTRDEVQRRFLRNLHPCNVFLAPGARNSRDGENPQVIAFMAERYASRYGLIWIEFLRHIRATALIADASFGDQPVQSTPIPAHDQMPMLQVGVSRAIAFYRATRLTFKRDLIEPLAPEEQFEVITPMGVYRFTKREFYADFANVARAASYREHGLYHGARLHLKAQRFRVPDQVGA
jgi:hypothetical protein